MISVPSEMLRENPPDLLALARAEANGERPNCDCQPVHAWPPVCGLRDCDRVTHGAAAVDAYRDGSGIGVVEPEPAVLTLCREHFTSLFPTDPSGAPDPARP